jgi:hypothetical protein
MLPMRKYRQRIHYTETDKALMWDRWRKGDSLETIARLFDRTYDMSLGPIPIPFVLPMHDV